jgi:hypothetical protein
MRDQLDSLEYSYDRFIAILGNDVSALSGERINELRWVVQGMDSNLIDLAYDGIDVSMFDRERARLYESLNQLEREFLAWRQYETSPSPSLLETYTLVRMFTRILDQFINEVRYQCDYLG